MRRTGNFLGRRLDAVQHVYEHLRMGFTVAAIQRIEHVVDFFQRHFLTLKRRRMHAATPNGFAIRWHMLHLPPLPPYHILLRLR